jgi:hypothetical protein
MTYIGSIDAAAAKPRFFEGEEAEELSDESADGFDAALPPGPDLRGNQIEDRNAHFFEMAGEAEMEIGIVGEDCGGGRVSAGVAEKFAVLAVDAREVDHDFGETDDGETGSVNDGGDALGLEFRTGATEELGRREGRITQRTHEGGGIHVARGFAGGDEEGGSHFSYGNNRGGKGEERVNFAKRKRRKIEKL